MTPGGVPFHGEFSSADASGLTEANSRFTLYGPLKTAVTLDSNDVVQVTGVLIAAPTNAFITKVYDGADNVVDAGETIARVNTTAANPCVAWTDGVPHFCQKGTYPKVITSGAGQVDVTIRGYIVRKGA